MRKLVLLGLLGVLAITAVALARPGTPVPVPAGACREPTIHVHKSQGIVELRCAGQVRGRFEATFGAHPTGPKERQGDERTPEGRYVVSSKVVSERFYRFLGISYPNADDRARAQKLGVDNPGGGIGIHGTRPRRAGLARAWTRVAHATGLYTVWGPTDGCIALANEDIEVLFDAVAVGTPVEITP
ncbi:MAG TPA: L,D-transpeptidase family protein [Polyangia bacterium]|nr:L,D-transpeptidase family protein [Polyangia bacterium]